MAVKNPYEKFVNAAESVLDLSDEVRRHQDATQWAYNVVVCKISKLQAQRSEEHGGATVN
eukprot:scaffold1810_cov60-Cyclotella_meneghiniana.AAC.20